MTMLSRRGFVAGAFAALAQLSSAKASHIGRSRLSAISDEVGATPAEAIAFAHKYGLQWLELRKLPGGKPQYFEMEEIDLKAAAKEFAANGIKISFLNTPLLKFGLPDTEPVTRKRESADDRAARLIREQSQFERRMDDLTRSIRAAQILGVDKMRIFTFSRVAEPEALFPRIAAIIDPMCRIAEKEGMQLLIENETSCNVAKCTETAAMLKLLPAKALGTNWDALNGADMGESAFPDGYAALPKNRIWNVQFKGKSLLDPSKQLDWAAIVRALEGDGYTGQLGLETHYFDGTNIEKAHLSMQEMLRIVEAS